MENSFIPDGVEIVSRAIAADNENEYEKALALYRDALARFTMGLKYEKNEARKKTHSRTSRRIHETSRRTPRLSQ
jgi:vacuolar protein-sorting-associated protein 4